MKFSDIKIFLRTRFRAILCAMLCLPALIACSHFTNPDHKSSSMIEEKSLEHISIPISLGGAFSSEHTIQLSMKDLVETGKRIIFGTDDPQAKLARGEAPIGKGQCPLCHKFFPEQRADRGPSMIPGLTNAHNGRLENDPNKNDLGLALSIEARSHQRVKEERYKIAKNRHARGEKNTGIKPHAKTGGEYLLESLYCPNCYVVDGYGLKGTKHTVSPMAIINKPPILLSDLEIISVIAYEQSRDTPGDYSNVTVLQDWENYFGRKLMLSFDTPKIKQKTKIQIPPVVTHFIDTPEEMVQKMTCFACHKIPSISIAEIGMIGPLLIMKTNAENRIRSAEYQKAVQEGRAHATTPKEYVIESIIDPGAFIVPGFADDMLKDYGHKFTVKALDKLADFLLTQGEEIARKEGLDRLSNEKEGSLFN